MKTVATLLVAACLLGDAAAATGTALVDAELGALHERNVNLAHLGRDKKTDSAAHASVSAGAALSVGDHHLASLTADLRGIAWERFTGLDSVAAGMTAAFRTKLGLGANAPWVRMSASAAREEYDVEVRDGWRLRIGPAIGTRLGERWDVTLEYTFEERIADHGKPVSRRLPGDVFDTTSHTASARASVLVTRRITAFAGYAFREGDVVSTTPRNAEAFAISTALAEDPAFGRDAVAYKVDAKVHVLGGGVSIALSPRASFNLGYEHHIGHTERGGIVYTNDLYRAGLMFAY